MNDPPAGKQQAWIPGAQDRTVLDFFMLFARFEYALKKAGYAHARRGQRVEPDWERFVEHVEAKRGGTPSWPCS